MARGTYSDATGAADLGAKLGEVAASKPAPVTKITLTIATPKPGKLQIKNADSHKVTEAETGKEVASMSMSRWSVDLPAGLYNVTFGPTVWRSVEVKAGETTVLDPATIEVLNAAAAGHTVLDWETGVEFGKISPFKRRLTVLPSTFTVTFGGTEWRQIEVKAGENKVLNPAVIVVKGASGRGHTVHTENGTLVATISSLVSVLPVPPGKYTFEAGDKKVPLDLAEGQRMEIDLK
jgi:hypothetical protein